MILKKHVLNIFRTPNQKISRLKKLRLDKNERISDFDKSFIKELKQNINSEMLTSYPELENLYKSLSKINNLPRNFFLTTFGIDHALKLSIEALTRSKDKVLILNPTFAMINIYCRLNNLSIQKLNYDKRLNLNIKKFLDSIKKNLNLIVISNPNSPTGTIINKKDMILLIKKAHKFKIPFILDEAYFGFYKETYIKFVKKYDNLIILRTFSKNYGLAGIRLGFICSSKKIINYLRKFKPMYEANNFGLMAANILLKNKLIEKKYVSETEKSKKHFISLLKDLNIKYFKSHANFILFKAEKNRSKICKFFKKNNILISSNTHSKNYLRVTLGPKSSMNNFFKIFKKNIKKFL